MSGPITVGYILLPGALELAKHALQEARSMKREYAEVADQLRAREIALADTRHAQLTARVERIAAVRREAARQAARVERLGAIVGALPALADSIPVAVVGAPADDTDASWSAYVAALEATAHDLETRLAEAGGTFGERLRETLAASGSAPTIDQVLGAYALQRQMNASLDATQIAHFRETAARILGRVELAEGAALPAELERLARAIVLAPSTARAEALASELRLGVQRHREAQRAQRIESEEARRLLAELPDESPAPLLRTLELVAAGIERLDETLQNAVRDVLDTAAADCILREQEAAAYVLEQSLRDLGYEVEDIESTLFADGGVVHFRRAGWDNYFVRMRVDPRERTANFNVVRASGDEDTRARRRLDAMAEDRWCTEFPRLMETLASRGLSMDVTRRLGAGEIPVQVVDGASLPAVHGDEAARPRTPPLVRRTP